MNESSKMHERDGRDAQKWHQDRELLTELGDADEIQSTHQLLL